LSDQCQTASYAPVKLNGICPCDFRLALCDCNDSIIIKVNYSESEFDSKFVRTVCLMHSLGLLFTFKQYLGDFTPHAAHIF